jgi:DNA-binding NtrC family response regulator
MSDKLYLVSIAELGGYPDFSPLYRRMGYEPVMVRNMRKALAQIKKTQPRVIVAEFNYQSDFRDRTSSLETLMAVVQRMPDTRVIVFYEREQAEPYQRVTSRFPIHASLTFPIDEQALETALAEIEETP